MKKTLKISFIFALLAGLIYPDARAVFLPVPAAQAHDIGPRQVVLVPAPRVVVDAQPAAAKTVVAVSQPVACTGRVAQTGNLVQDTSLINLNLPGNCFSLGQTKVAQPAANLAVQPLAQPLPQIVIVIPQPYWAAPELSGSSVPASLPALPLAAFAVAVFFAIRKEEVASFRSRMRNQSVNFGLNLEQLQMLRC